MAFRTWARILLAALGVAALAGASQLGVGYGLGVVRLTRVFDAAGRDQWHAQLAWVAWFAMVAAVAGGLAGGRFHQRWAPAGPTAVDPGTPSGSATPDAEPTAGAAPTGLWARIAIAVAAGIGATAVVPLTMQPARTAMIDAVDAGLVIGICAGLGALVGVFAAYAALSHLVARWSFGALVGAVWLIAVVSVAPSLGPDDALPSVRLGVFDAGFLAPATTQRFALFTMPALALLAGALLGWAARRREFSPFTIAFAGLGGPALVMVAYLIAGPGGGGQRYQVVPYWAAMAAVGTGVLGAVIAAVIRRGTDADETPGEEDGAPEGSPSMPPLPRRRTGQPNTPAESGSHAAPSGTDTTIPGTGVAAAAPPPPAPIGEPVPRPYESGSFAGPLLGAGSRTGPPQRHPASRDDRSLDAPYAGPYPPPSGPGPGGPTGRPGPFPPSLAAPQDSDSYLDPADFRSTGPETAPDRDVPAKRGLPGFRRSRTKATPDPRSRPGAPPEPTSVGTQPHQISAPLPHPTPVTAPIAPPRPVTPHPSAFGSSVPGNSAPGHPVPGQPTQGAPHPAALPHLVAPAYSPVPPPTAPAPRSAPQGTPRTRKNASPEPFPGPAEGIRPTGERPTGDRASSDRMGSDRTDGRPGKRAADREDPSGRRPARGNEAPVRKKDEDFVDWVSGLGND